MTPGKEDGPERTDDDMLAAEYVLGVLPAGERLAVAARIERDAVFARQVEAWEGRLSPLNDAYEDVAPSVATKAALDARLFGASAQSANRPRPGLIQSLAFWRAVAAGAVFALLVAIAVPFFQPPAERLAASLAGEDSGVSYLVVYDAAAGEVGLSHVAGDREAGRDFELWAIEGSNPPVSLGVIPAGASAHIRVAPERRNMIAAGVLFAISLEPQGGSPTGQPTGPVVAAGDLRSI